MSITKKEVLENIEQVKKNIEESEKESKTEKVVGIEIRSIFGNVIFRSTKTTFVEAIRDVYLSEANFREVDLSGSNLRGVNLRGVNFREADLSGSNLRGANLSGSDLSGANLREAELMSAKFYGKGGTKQLKKSQLPDFLGALGFVIVD